jgi:hypothetical protein
MAAATNSVTPATEAQLKSIAALSVAMRPSDGWNAESIGTRIIGHDQEAIWIPDSMPERRRWES